MTREEHERRKQRIEEETRAAVELIEAGGRAQLRALELVWMTSDDGAFAAPVGPPLVAASAIASPPTPLPRRRTIGDVEADVRAALPRCPETFDRRDMCAALGYDPDRATLYRLLCELTQEGLITVIERGEGRRGTRYRRTP